MTPRIQRTPWTEQKHSSPGTRQRHSTQKPQNSQNKPGFLCGFREFCVDRRGWETTGMFPPVLRVLRGGDCRICATLRAVTTPNRWLPVIGGVMMNMALGTFYAMSVFMLPLEKEFGWTRTQTSWVTTIGMVMIASWYVIAGYIHDRRGPQLVAAIGGT